MIFIKFKTLPCLNSMALLALALSGCGQGQELTEGIDFSAESQATQSGTSAIESSDTLAVVDENLSLPSSVDSPQTGSVPTASTATASSANFVIVPSIGAAQREQASSVPVKSSNVLPEQGSEQAGAANGTQALGSVSPQSTMAGNESASASASTSSESSSDSEAPAQTAVEVIDSNADTSSNQASQEATSSSSNSNTSGASSAASPTNTSTTTATDGSTSTSSNTGSSDSSNSPNSAGNADISSTSGTSGSSEISTTSSSAVSSNIANTSSTASSPNTSSTPSNSGNFSTSNTSSSSENSGTSNTSSSSDSSNATNTFSTPGASESPSSNSSSQSSSSSSAAGNSDTSTASSDSESSSSGQAAPTLQPPVFDGDLAYGETLGSAECVDITNTNKDFGEVTDNDWRAWFSNYTYSLRPEYLDTGIDGDRAFFRQKLIPTSIGSHHVQAGSNLNANRTYRITQSLFFEAGFDWGGKNEGGKVGFGFGGGSAPSGGLLQTDGFTLRLMWRGNKDGTAKLVAYSYAADRGQHLPYGDDYPLEGFEIPIGEWFDITIEVKTNSSTGVNDGSLRAWADGELRLHRENIGWQTSGSKPAVQKLVYTTFYGGNDTTWAPSHTTYIRFADTCWAPVVSDSLQNDPLQDSVAFTMLLEDAIVTARGRIIQALSEVEVLLPTQSVESNEKIYNALNSLNTALAIHQWLDNDTVSLDSSAVDNIGEAAATLREIAADPAMPVHIREQTSRNSDILVYAVYLLTDSARADVEDKLSAQGCTLEDRSSYCSNAYLGLDQAAAWLSQSELQMVNNAERLKLIKSAWLAVRQAADLS